MARLLGPDNNSRMAVLPSGAPAASRTGTVYANAAGTVLADILAYQPGNPTVPGAVIAGSVVTTDAFGMLPLFWWPDGLDVLWVSVNGGPVVPINADYDARLDALGTRVTAVETARAMGWRIVTDPTYGTVDLTGVADSTAAVQAASNDAANANTALFFPPGIIKIAGTVNLIPGKVTTWRGSGRGATGSSIGTILQKSGAGSVVSGVGTGTTVPTRIRFDIQAMAFYGAVAGAPVVKLQRCNDSLLSDVLIAFGGSTLLQATEWWNCVVRASFFQNGGNGTASPAVLLDASTDPANGASGNTISFADCEWEANTGTDLRITGSPGGGGFPGQDWTIAVQFSNCKMERDTGNFPLIDLDRAGAIEFTGGFLHLGPSATGTHIIQNGVACVPSRPNHFSGVNISGNKWNGVGAAGDAVVPYFVEHTVGSLHFANVSLNGTPTSAFFHVGSGVGLNDFRLSNTAVTDRSKLILDDRPGSLYGYGSINLQPVISGVAATNSVNRPIWVFPDAATNTLYYANVALPADAAVGRPPRVRVLWYSDAAAGDIRWNVGMRYLAASGDDITLGQSDKFATATVPAVANRTTTTTFIGTTTASVAPEGTFVAIYLARLGADVADTCTGGGRVLGVELLYEKAM